MLWVWRFYSRKNHFAWPDPYVVTPLASHWQLAGSPVWDSKHPYVATVGDSKHPFVALVWNANTCVWPRFGIQTPVRSPGWGSKRPGILKHLYVAPVGDPDAWAYPKHLCAAPFGLAWSLKAILQVATQDTREFNALMSTVPLRRGKAFLVTSSKRARPKTPTEVSSGRHLPSKSHSPTLKA